MHAHNYIEVMYVTKGKCTVSVQIDNDVVEIPLWARQFILIDFDVYHKIAVNSPTAIMNIELKAAPLPSPCGLPFGSIKNNCPELMQFIQSFRHCAVLEDVAGVNKIMRQIYAENLKPATNNDVVTQSLINVFFVYISRCKDTPPPSHGEFLLYKSHAIYFLPYQCLHQYRYAR